MVDVWLCYAHSFNDDIVHLLDHLVDRFVPVNSSQLIYYSSIRSFVANVIIGFVGILLIVRVIFVDGVVCEVHKQVIEVAADWGHVLRRSKACKSLLVYENAEWSYTRN